MSSKQQKWATKMVGYDYENIYKKGKYNAVVDALLQKYEEPSTQGVYVAQTNEQAQAIQ